MKTPPATTFQCIDAHTCGNPVRVVTSGKPELVGETMLDKREHFLQEFDWIRTALMFEPRGHAMTIVTPGFYTSKPRAAWPCVVTARSAP
jgi:proline racemase